MKIRIEEQGNVSVIRLDGKLTTGSGDVSLRQTIKDLLDKDRKSILIDMARVKNIDSGGIGEMVSSYTTAKNRGAALKLLNMPERAMAIFHMTQLITVFEVYEDEKEALTSF
ncbi:MAG TPA: STAS domain-containing protein [Thermoanaerobaculia bacterium]|nr:STAS domain-containing protein [Thermoanaerobaculia bacterium]HUM30308.1 STAS domain-containing protein [Thermoanaerobaculia bacterium]HXK68541.1 STAS domain-containing protein [Thermoanaerobaculia bacterium]